MDLNFRKMDGLVSAVVQDDKTNRVLMVGFMNDKAWKKTRETGFVTLYSRSRKRLWTKGETSGHKLAVREIRTDCDADAVLIRVEALGPGVCHEGFESCFFRQLDDGAWKRVDEQTFDPKAVYGGAS